MRFLGFQWVAARRVQGGDGLVRCSRCSPASSPGGCGAAARSCATGKNRRRHPPQISRSRSEFYALEKARAQRGEAKRKPPWFYRVTRICRPSRASACAPPAPAQRYRFDPTASRARPQPPAGTVPRVRASKDLMRPFLFVLVFAATRAAPRRTPIYQKQLIQPTRHRRLRAPAAPVSGSPEGRAGESANLDSRQLWDRHQLEIWTRNQTDRSKAGTPEALRSYEAPEARGRESAFQSPIAEVPLQPAPPDTDEARAQGNVDLIEAPR